MTTSPGPPSRTSMPPLPIRTSSPASPVSVSLPGLPIRMSLPSPPWAVKLTVPAASSEAVHRYLASIAHDDDHVVGIGGVDHDRIGCTVAAAGDAEVNRDLRHVGPGHVVHMDGVRAAERLKGDVLDVVEVHRDAGDITSEARVAAVCRDVDLLGDVGAVELQGVDPSLAFDGVTAVSGVPDESVVAPSH